MTAPRLVSDSKVLEVVAEKENWIREHRERVIARAQEMQSDNGKQTDSPENENGRGNVTDAQVQRLKEQIEFYAKKWEPVMGVHCNRYTIRDMKTRWGSCSVQKKTIRINLQLAKKPEECVEYVVVHELTHLLEPSHNRVFHAYMKRFLPDYKEREKLLK